MQWTREFVHQGLVLRRDCVQGNMPALLSHYRPDAIIYAFTENRAVQRRLALYHGVYALHMPFGETADETFERYSSLLLDPAFGLANSAALPSSCCAVWSRSRPWKLSTTFRSTTQKGSCDFLVTALP